MGRQTPNALRACSPISVRLPSGRRTPFGSEQSRFDRGRGVVATTMTSSARIHERLDHPVIDGDGHVVEFRPVFADFVGDHGRSDLVESCPFFGPDWTLAWETASRSQRRAQGLYASAFWFVPAEAEYWATVTTPSRYAERLGEAGIDFSVLYPTSGLALADDRRRGDPDDAVSPLQRVHGRGVRTARRSDDHGGVDPDAHPAGGRRSARARGGVGFQGRVDPELRPAARRSRPAGADLDRFLWHRQRPRLRPGVEASDRAALSTGVPFDRNGVHGPVVGVELHVQPHRTLRRGW